MRKVHLYGRLAKKFGKVFELDIRTPGEAIRALSANFPDFTRVVREGSWVIRVGSKISGESVDEKELELGLGRNDLHIMPAIRGSKNSGGVLKVILGAVLVGAALFFTAGTALGMATPLLGGLTGTNIALLGLGIAMAGASQLMTSQNDTDEGSYSFTGPVNMNNQGNAIPLIYGFSVAVGSTPISASIDVEQV